MLGSLKRLFYFPVARYFIFFASIYLKRWKPTVVVVTGSAGKTTLLHLIESQLGDGVRYSHKANSSFGIPFDVLGLKRDTLLRSEWIWLFLRAPLRAFGKARKERVYVVEADCDRPYEGKFLADFLRPDVVLWVSVARTHGMNFESLVKRGDFKDVEEAIAFEFGYFLEYCRGVAMINGDSKLMKGQVGRTRAKVVEVRKSMLEEYRVGREGTVFVVDGEKYVFRVLLPEEVFYSLSMCIELNEILRLPSVAQDDKGRVQDDKFKNFSLPPGRSSIFSGIRETTIIDCSYNVDLSSARAVLDMFEKMEAKHKWVVIGDILEQGAGERVEHERLAELLNTYDFERIILMGPRVYKYSYPIVIKKLSSGNVIKSKVERFEGPREALDYLKDNLKGGEMVLFKGARFMEGIIEHLLEDKRDVAKLARREKVWENRRRSFGL